MAPAASLCMANNNWLQEQRRAGSSTCVWIPIMTTCTYAPSAPEARSMAGTRSSSTCIVPSLQALLWGVPVSGQPSRVKSSGAGNPRARLKNTSYGTANFYSHIANKLLQVANWVACCLRATSCGANVFYRGFCVGWVAYSRAFCFCVCFLLN